MKFLLDNWYLVLVAIASGGLLLWPSLRGGAGGGNAVGPAEAVRLINREKALLIDVNEPADYAAGHAGGARNVPLSGLDGAKNLPANKALPIVVIGNGGSAGKAAAALRKAGYADVRTLAGGFTAWRDASLPVEKSAAGA